VVVVVVVVVLVVVLVRLVLLAHRLVFLVVRAARHSGARAQKNPSGTRGSRVVLPGRAPVNAAG
jgi:hypothetical protein